MTGTTIDSMRASTLFGLLVACSRDPLPIDPVGSPPDPVSVEESGVVLCPADTVAGYGEELYTLDPAEEMFLAGAGFAVIDVDGNGWVDIVAPSDVDSRLYLGGPEGFTASDLPSDLSLPTAVSAADYDDDGDLDLFVSRYGHPDRLLRNDWPAFVDVAEEAGVDGGNTHSVSSAWADYDGDGDLDLVVAGHGAVEVGDPVFVIDTPADPSRLYENLGDGTFADRGALLPQRAHDSWTFVATWTELDGDGLPDLLMANDFPQYDSVFPLLNRPEGFEIDDGLGLSVYMAAMGVGVGDLDGDAVDDFVLPAWGANALLMSGGLDVWVNQSVARGLVPDFFELQVVGWGAALEDGDNDGDLDVAMGYGYADLAGAVTPDGAPLTNPVAQPDEMYLNEGETFRPIGQVLGLDWPGPTRALLMVDLDGNGTLDLVRRDLDGMLVVHRAACTPAAWLEVSLEQPPPNVHAVGAEVWVEAADRSWRRTVRAGGTSLGVGGPPVVHFGLGDIDEVDVIVRWPGGGEDRVQRVSTRQVVRVRRR